MSAATGVARLVRNLNLEARGQRRRTTVPGDLDERPADLVNRNFRAPAPIRLVADLTPISTSSGFVYLALIIDAFSRSVVGWRELMARRRHPPDVGSQRCRRAALCLQRRPQRSAYEFAPGAW